jgi:hypothetical protein
MACGYRKARLEFRAGSFVEKADMWKRPLSATPGHRPNANGPVSCIGSDAILRNLRAARTDSQTSPRSLAAIGQGIVAHIRVGGKRALTAHDGLRASRPA